jgi:hypothetical protein
VGSLRLLAVAATGLASLMVMALPQAAGAASVDMTTSFGPQVFVNTCNGDVVTVIGEMHMVAVTNDNKAEFQINWPDTAGVADSGRLYQVNDAFHFFIVTVPDGSFTIGLRDSFELVSQDGSSNMLFHETIEITFSPKDGFGTKITGAGADCSGPG